MQRNSGDHTPLFAIQERLLLPDKPKETLERRESSKLF
jgi:hypothetical protein